MVGDDVAPRRPARPGARATGPGWIGVAAAFALALGLRSGSRGGPLALERAEVRHVLLAPVDRTTALRAPAIRQLRFLAFVGLVVGRHRRGDGVAADDRQHRRLGGHRRARRAHVRRARGRRRPRRRRHPAAALGWRRSSASSCWGWRVADGVDAIAVEPDGAVRRPGAVAAAVRRSSASCPVAGRRAWRRWSGLTVLGRVSLEAAERRSTPGRPAAVRRHAAGPAHRDRAAPPARHGAARGCGRGCGCGVRGTGRWPVFVRGLRGVLRWPAARVARLVLLGGRRRAVPARDLGRHHAAARAWPAWPCSSPASTPSSRWPRRSTTPAAATRRRLDPASIHLRHIPMGLVGQLLVAGVAMGVASLPGDGRLPGAVAAVAVVPLALGGLARRAGERAVGPADDERRLGAGAARGAGHAPGVPHRVAARPSPSSASLPVLFARDAIEQGRTGSERRHAVRRADAPWCSPWCAAGCGCATRSGRGSASRWSRPMPRREPRPPVLEADGASKAYADLVALEPLTLQRARGPGGRARRAQRLGQVHLPAPGRRPARAHRRGDHRSPASRPARPAPGPRPASCPTSRCSTTTCRCASTSPTSPPCTA